MSRPNPVVLLAVLAAFVAGVSALSLLKGGLYIARHEGDMLHLLEILFRLERGEIPHLDFMTPIGAFAFLPIHAFMASGMGVDQAIHWAQASVAAALLPVVWWTALTRFPGLLAYAFGLVCLVLVTALVHGETVDAVSISMHYNRWAWALAFVAIALAVLRPLGAPRPLVDGAILGLCIAGLVMIKVTYAVALGPAILVALLLRHERRMLLAAAAAGLIVAAGVTAWGGIGYWAAYLGDLATVAASDVRPSPSLDLAGTLVAPAYLGGTLAALLAVVLLRRAGAKEGGLLTFLLLPGFAYVTYQNFGNDPQWLALLGLLLLVLRHEADLAAVRPAQALGYVATVLFAFAAPSYINLAYSPVRHALADPGEYAPLIPRSERHAGFRTADIRANQIDGLIPLDGPGSGLETYRELADRPEPVEFRGETLPQCEVMLGLPGWLDGIARDLEAAGYAGDTRIFAADIFSSHWMFNGGQPLVKGAPWYYGGLPGWESADYLLVPLCPALPPVRRSLLELVEETGATFTEVRRTPLYILYSIS